MEKDLMELAAIWADETVNIKRDGDAIKTKRIIDGDIVEYNDSEHKIVGLYGNVDSSVLKLNIMNLDTNLPEIVDAKVFFNYQLGKKIEASEKNIKELESELENIKNGTPFIESFAELDKLIQNDFHDPKTETIISKAYVSPKVLMALEGIEKYTDCIWVNIENFNFDNEDHLSEIFITHRATDKIKDMNYSKIIVDHFLSEGVNIDLSVEDLINNDEVLNKFIDRINDNKKKR